MASLAPLQAQIAGTYKRVEIGGGLGATQYTGELANMPKLGNTRLAGQLFARYNFTTYFNVRGNFSLGRIAGSAANSGDNFYQGTGYTFKSNYSDLSVLLEYNFFNFRGTREPYRFTPFIFGGVGMSNATVIPNNSRADYVPVGPVLSLPFGVGIKRALSQHFNVEFEVRTVKVFSDDIDGLSREPRSSALFNWAYKTKKDLYYFAGVSLTYRFITTRCPESSLDYAGER
jgi:hypothetical protein